MAAAVLEPLELRARDLALTEETVAMAALRRTRSRCPAYTSPPTKFGRVRSPPVVLLHPPIWSTRCSPGDTRSTPTPTPGIHLGPPTAIYSNFANGNVNGVGIGSIGNNANTGRVKITGDDPLNLTFVNSHAVFGAPGAGYNMRYPAGNLVYNGVWYSVTILRNALGVSGCAYTCTQGALVGFDYTLSPATAKAEASWVKTTHTAATPLFPETGLNGTKVKLGEPHFVDFGKNLQYSPDGKAYLVGHGAANAADFVNWNAGSDIYLARVTPSPDSINDLSKWEFYKGVDASNAAIWSTGFSGLQPILAWGGQLGNVSITYDAPLKRYIMTLSRGNKMPDDWNRSDVLLLHSANDSLTGGWNLVRIWHDSARFRTCRTFPPSSSARTAKPFGWVSRPTTVTARASCETPWGPPIRTICARSEWFLPRPAGGF